MNQSPSRPALEAELQRVTTQALSPRSRYGHVVLLLTALAMSVLLGALLATEPDIPRRTQLAFAVMLGIGMSWAGYASWVLGHRRALLANHRIVAGRMAVAFTALFSVGALATALSTGTLGFYVAAGTGAVMLALAVAMLASAHRHVARLQAQRRELERELERPKK